MRRQVGLLGVVAALFGCASHSCKRDSDLPMGPQRGGNSSSTSAVDRATVLLETAKKVVRPDLATLLRGRQFSEALLALSNLAPADRTHPQVRFIEAYASRRAGDAPRAVTLLSGLEAALPELTLEIGRLRAQAQLETSAACVGAAVLSPEYDPSAWLRAAQTLDRLGQSDGVLLAVERGLSAEAGSKSARSDWRRVKLRGLRIKTLTALGRGSEAATDVRALLNASVESDEVDREVEQAFEGQPTAISPAQTRQRLERLAERGRIESVERSLEALAKHRRLSVTKAEALSLRGRARLMARREPAEGARLLIQAAELGHPEASQLRLDAARLWVRQGKVAESTKIYLQVAQGDPRRAEESLYYAARTQATLGEPREADALYARLLTRFPKGKKADSVRYERVLNWMVLGQYDRALAVLVPWSKDSRYLSNRAVISELTGLALERVGKLEEAKTQYLSVLEQFPLELAGLYARARLVHLGVGVPVRPPPAAHVEQKLDSTVESKVRLLLQWGLDELAADAYREQIHKEASRSRAGGKSRTYQEGCANWSVIGYGPQGFALSRALRATVKSADSTAQGASQQLRWAFDCRFPRPYRQLVERIESEFDLPKDLIFSVMRQESSFDPTVVSPANAKGLLQLLDETAKRAAASAVEKGGEVLPEHPPAQTPGAEVTTEVTVAPKGAAYDLFEPRDNVRLGAAYLRQLLGWFKGDLLLTVAAYNAGPSAVVAWAKAGEGIAPELFAARIPYAETRGYVEHVLGNLSMYRYLQGANSDLPQLSLELPSKIEGLEEYY